MDRYFPYLLVCLFSLFWAAGVQSADKTASGSSPPVRIALIIDDMGNQLNSGLRAVKLPGSITYAFLPHTPYVSMLAKLAYSKGKQVMLHQPLESHTGNRLGPGGLTLHMKQQEFKDILAGNIAAIPHVKGVNNHMGSLMTRHPGAMRWLMEVLGETGLFFVDSRTTKKTVAHGVAKESSIAAISRDVFLDHDRDKARIRGQIRNLLRVAKEQGRAVGIGHPYQETLEVLEEEIPRFAEQGIELVLVSELAQIDFKREVLHPSSSSAALETPPATTP